MPSVPLTSPGFRPLRFAISIARSTLMGSIAIAFPSIPGRSPGPAPRTGRTIFNVAGGAHGRTFHGNPKGGASLREPVSLFGSSGIRGLANVDVTPDLALAVGRAVGAQYRDVIVGRDPRLSGRMLASAFASGVLSVGGSVCDAGLVSTPTLARGASGYGCGAVITASHNPGEYNGIKLWNPDGMAFAGEQQEDVERSLAAKDWTAARWDATG